MASIRKRGTKWRAEVYRDGTRESGTFLTKAQAVAWAMQREAELVGERLPDHTVKDALRRFARDVSPLHKGAKWELVRLTMLERDALASARLPSLSASDVAAWRDRRLQAVSGASVRREMNLLSSVFRKCAREWRWLRASPMPDVDKPPSPASRKRRIPQDEIDRITLALGYNGGVPETISHRVALAFLFAIETAMRSGEILGMRWRDVVGKKVILPMTKNGDVREVPLTPYALEILSLLPREDGPVFGLIGEQRDALFRKARDKAKVANLHFHDSRAEAIWRLSRDFDPMELARVIGHRDLRSLLIYYQTDADELADRLGSRRATPESRLRPKLRAVS